MSHGNHGNHGGHGAQTQPGTDSTSPSTKAYEMANERMHREMMIQFTGDADKDFIAGMIPHHRGAVDMAAILLKSQIRQEPTRTGTGRADYSRARERNHFDGGVAQRTESVNR